MLRGRIGAVADRIDDPMLFDWTDFWSADLVQLMTDREVVAYLRLLSAQWRDGALPDDPRLLALRISDGVRPCGVGDLIGIEATLEGVVQPTLEAPLQGSLWGALKGGFQRVDGELQNERVERERSAWLAKKQGWKLDGRAGGIKSAKARAAKRKKRKAEERIAGVLQKAETEGRVEATLEGGVQPTLEGGVHPSLSHSGSPSGSSPDPDPALNPGPGKEEEREEDPAPRAADPAPPASSPFDVLQDLLTEREKAQLGRLLADRAEIAEPRSCRAPSQVDESAMRAERVHLLARLIDMTPADPAAEDQSTALELWASWRAKARRKAKKTGASNWLGEVKALRQLVGLPPEKIQAVLLAADEKGWQGLDLSWPPLAQILGLAEAPRGYAQRVQRAPRVSAAAGSTPTDDDNDFDF